MSKLIDDLLQNRSDVVKLDLALQLVNQVLDSVGDLAEGSVSLSGACAGIASAIQHLSLREGDFESELE